MMLDEKNENAKLIERWKKIIKEKYHVTFGYWEL